MKVETLVIIIVFIIPPPVAGRDAGQVKWTVSLKHCGKKQERHTLGVKKGSFITTHLKLYRV